MEGTGSIAKTAPCLKNQASTTGWVSTPQGLTLRHAAVASSSNTKPGNVRAMFRSTKTSTDIHDADGVPAPRDALDGSLPWTCRLKLHNPHNLCYMNSGVVALLHTYVLQDRIPSPMRRISVGEAVWLPIFAEGINVVWESFRVTAVQVHLGHSPHQGHCRSLLRAGGLWLYQDDGCQAKQVTFSAIHKRHGYLVWLLKSCA